MLRNPVLFGVAALVSLLQLPQFALQLSPVDPLVTSVVSLALTGVFVFVVPFVVGGMLGMANEAIDGETRLGTFVAAGKASYVSLLVAYFAVLVASFVLGIVTTIVVLVGGVAAVAGGSGGHLALLGVGGVVLLVLLVAFVAMLFVQFYPQAIVVDGLGALDGAKRSVGLVRRNLLSVVGYTLLVTVVSSLFGLVGGLASVVFAPPSTASPAATPTPFAGLPEPSLGLAVALGALVLVGGALLGGFFATYSVAFYRDLRHATAGV